MSIRKLSILFLLCTLLSTANAQISIPPTHGTGTQADPFQIATLENLCWVSQLGDYYNRYFIQTADIDASATITWNDGKGFYPIGYEWTSFDGHYNGQGHTIRSLYVNQTTSYGAGLFGSTMSASIQNLKLIECNITGYYCSGGIIGQAVATIVSDCFVSGTITGNDYTGGIIGFCQQGNITNSYSNATVNGNNDTGGLIGTNDDSDISFCYASGNVTGTNRVGGLTGRNAMYSNISNCHATGNIIGVYGAGGLVGGNEMNSSINNCYATGSVQSDYAGGLVGSNEMTSTINNCYSVGKVLSQLPDYSGSLVGSNYFNSSINESYWNINTSGQTSGVGSNEFESTSSALGLDSYEMKSQVSYEGWDFTATWDIIEGISFPVLKGLNSVPIGYPDTICTRRNLALRKLLINDFDYETGPDSLVFRICNVSAGIYHEDTLFVPIDVNLGDTIVIEYQPGELYKEVPDTLWGNKVRSIFIYKNTSPAIISTVNISIPEDSRYIFTWNDISAADEDSDNLSIIPKAGDHYAFNGDTLVPEPDFNGMITVNLAVSDGMDTSFVQTIQVDVIAVNDAPVVKDIFGTMLENDTLTIEVSASDVDGTIRTIVTGNDPQNGSAKHSGMKITYIPDKGFCGKDSITWYAIDNNNSLSAEAKFVIAVNMSNHAPVITSQAPVAAAPGEEYVYPVSASDINDDSLSFNLTNAPEGMAISAEGIITWIPGTGTTTSGEIMLRVSDGEFEVTEIFTITVSGLSSVEKESEPTLILYPNPCVNGFYIEAGTEKAILVQIYDMNGRLVFTQPAKDVTWIDISHLKAGSYVVSINSKMLQVIKK